MLIFVGKQAEMGPHCTASLPHYLQPKFTQEITGKKQSQETAASFLLSPHPKHAHYCLEEKRMRALVHGAVLGFGLFSLGNSSNSGSWKPAPKARGG